MIADDAPTSGGPEDGATAPEPDGAAAAGGAGWDAGDDPRVRDGLDHLQRAAREVISASRALLDLAEELVEDPRTAAGVVDLLGSVATRARAAGEAAGRAAGRAGPSGRTSAQGPGDDGDDDPPVQRIPVS
ncbi:MAG: hypothetical protein KDA94_01465 [Acidimicrobiales bacterium]|nr:hypothetical protein [Acidimicrobiales bacterium]